MSASALSPGALAASVSFLPIPEAPNAARDVSSDATGVPCADRLLRGLGQPLTELAWRARRLGPVDSGALVLLSGCASAAGCSTVALALARAAVEEMSVLLIDADLARAGLSRLFGKPFRIGWEDAVRGLCPFEQAVHYADHRRQLAFLPLRKPVDNPGMILEKPALNVWLSQLRQDYDLIVFDGGQAASTGKLWASRVDLALLVCDARETSPPARAQAWDALEEGNTHVLGIVETFVDNAE